MILFKYREEIEGRGRRVIKRPVADVFLKTKLGMWSEFHPYIDSGADLTLIPLSLGKLIGLRLGEGKVDKIRGVRGGVPVVYTVTEMRIGGRDMKIRVAWSLIEDVPPLLGRTDIFDLFDVTFRQRDGIIEFKERNG